MSADPRLNVDPTQLDFIFREIQAREAAIREGDHRPVLNTQEGIFSNLQPQMKSAMTAAFLAIATPVLKSGAERVRVAGLDFLGFLGGKSSANDQFAAAQEVLEFEESGQAQSEGMKALLEANPAGIENLARKFRQGVEQGAFEGVTLPVKGRSFFGNFDLLSILAPTRGDISRKMKISEKEDNERMRREGAKSAPRATRAADTDATAKDENVRQKQEATERVSKETNINSRNDMIDVVNTANNFNQDQELELLPDEFLYDLQEQRIQVNQRPVPSYSQAVNRMSGIHIPITVSPLYV